ncbi:MAG: hypothetical protein GY930_20895, partial [bacterium]|nr:hypothetical protein [bacterium]
ATPDALTQASEFQAHVSGAIAGLPPLLRDAVHGSLVDGKRPSQMAVDLGLEPGTMRQRLRRGLGLLRLQLQAGLVLAIGMLGLRSSPLASSRKALLDAASSKATPATAGNLVLSGSKATTFKLATFTGLCALAITAAWLGSQRPSASTNELNPETNAHTGPDELVAKAGHTQQRSHPADSGNAKSPGTEDHTDRSPALTGTRLKVVDPNGHPIAHLPVKVIPGPAQDFKAWDSWTNEFGELTLKPSTSPVEIQLRNNIPHLTTKEVSPTGSGAILNHSTTLLQPGFDSYEVTADSRGQWIQLVDAETGQPINREVHVDFERHSQLESYGGFSWNPLEKHLFSRTHRTTHEGWTQLFSTGSITPKSQLVLWTQGYEPKIEVDPASFFNPAISAQRVLLKPNEHQAKKVKLVDRDGISYQGWVTVSDLGLKRFLSVQVVTKDNPHPSVPWFGNDLLLKFPQPGMAPITIKSSDLRGPGELVVVMRTTLGTVVINNVPPNAPAAQLMPCGFSTPIPASNEYGTSIEFTGLAPGKYLAGTNAWVSTEFWRSNTPGFEWDLELGSGEALRQDWNPEWVKDTPPSGSVSFPGRNGSFHPYAFPIYGAYAVGSYIGLDEFRIEINAQGKYELALHPRPGRFMIVRDTPGSKRQVLALVPSDEICSIALGSIRITAPNGVAPGTLIAYNVPREFYPDIGNNNWYVTPWIPGRTEMVLHNVPRVVTHIGVGQDPSSHHNHDSEFAVEWSQDPVTELEIELPNQGATPSGPGFDASAVHSSEPLVEIR